MTGFDLTVCRGGFPNAWDMANARYSMALPHPPTTDAAAPSSKSDLGRQRNLVGRKSSGRQSVYKEWECVRKERWKWPLREIWEERGGRIPVRSRTPEVWKGGGLFTLHSILPFYCTSLLYNHFHQLSQKPFVISLSHGIKERRRSLDVNSKKVMCFRFLVSELLCIFRELVSSST